MTPEMIQRLIELHEIKKFAAARYPEGRAAQQVEALGRALALLSAGTWQPINAEAKDGRPVLVALIKDGRVWRVSDAKHNGLGFYTINGGAACHWATHSMPLPAPPSDGDQR